MHDMVSHQAAPGMSDGHLSEVVVPLAQEPEGLWQQAPPRFVIPFLVICRSAADQFVGNRLDDPAQDRCLVVFSFAQDHRNLESKESPFNDILVVTMY